MKFKEFIILKIVFLEFNTIIKLIKYLLYNKDILKINPFIEYFKLQSLYFENCLLIY